MQQGDGDRRRGRGAGAVNDARSRNSIRRTQPCRDDQRLKVVDPDNGRGDSESEPDVLPTGWRKTAVCSRIRRRARVLWLDAAVWGWGGSSCYSRMRGGRTEDRSCRIPAHTHAAQASCDPHPRALVAAVVKPEQRKGWIDSHLVGVDEPVLDLLLELLHPLLAVSVRRQGAGPTDITVRR